MGQMSGRANWHKQNPRVKRNMVTYLIIILNEHHQFQYYAWSQGIIILLHFAAYRTRFN